MSILVKQHSPYDLRLEKYKDVIKKLKTRLEGRVINAYIFGSLSTGKLHNESDIDLILIKETNTKFIQRTFEFEDLFDIYPDIDILVYTQDEFDKKIKEESDIGFWKSVKEQMIQII